MTTRVLRNNWYDFQKVSKEDLEVEQSSNNTNVAITNDTVVGSGVLLEFPTEKVIFDSASLSTAQQGWVAVDTFDGRGILEAPIASSDLDEGTQISIVVSGSKIVGAINMVATILGKTFDNDLIYEHLE